MSDEWDEGYESGREDGYDRGYAIGHEDGREAMKDVIRGVLDTVHSEQPDVDNLVRRLRELANGR